MPKKLNIKALVIEELKKILKEESELPKDYISKQVRDFISKSDTNSIYKPQIKLSWSGDNAESKTKYLSVDWGTMIKIINLLKNENN